MSIKTSQIGSNWITFLVISITIHITLIILSFSPETFDLVTPGLHKTRAAQGQKPFYVEVITLPPGVTGKKITPKQLTRFANESRSVEVEGAPAPVSGKGRPSAQTPPPAKKPDLSPPGQAAASQRTGSSRGLSSGKAVSGNTGTPATGGKTGKKTGKNKRNRDKAANRAEKGKKKSTRKSSGPSGKVMKKDDVIIDLPEAAGSRGRGNGSGNQGVSDGGKTGANKKGGEVGPPSLFPSERSIARVIRKNRRRGSQSRGGIYMRNNTKQLQINATELKDARYLLDLKRKLDLYWQYPMSAARRGEQGTLRARFKVKRDGTIFDIKLVKSSGYPTLDDAVINALRLCSPLNPLPDDFKKDVLNVKARFKYILTQVQ